MVSSYNTVAIVDESCVDDGSGSPLPADNILITPGAIAANHLVFYSLLGPGDHVICHYPTYQQLYAVPASLGAEVDLWRADPAKKWIPDLEDLKQHLKPNTKMIIIKYAHTSLRATGSV